MRLFASICLLLFLVACEGREAWCDKRLRPELGQLTPIVLPNKWFNVYAVGDSVYAIMEPHNYQEVISYLIVGERMALLFDTGMGMDSISPIVKALTGLPVVVLNSHTHHDHIGGNYEFSNVLAMDTDYTRRNAAHGGAHEKVMAEVTPESFCRTYLPGLDTAHYSIHPFGVTSYIHDGYTIDLGGRTLTVMATPGHTPDAIALWEQQRGLLWTGDTYYNGPIFLFDSATDLAAYQASIGKLAALAPRLKRILPAHNIPFADPHELIAAHVLFDQIRRGAVKGETDGSHILSFTAKKFSFLIDSSLLYQKAIQ